MAYLANPLDVGTRSGQKANGNELVSLEPGTRIKSKRGPSAGKEFTVQAGFVGEDPEKGVVGGLLDPSFFDVIQMGPPRQEVGVLSTEEGSNIIRSRQKSFNEMLAPQTAGAVPQQTGNQQAPEIKQTDEFVELINPETGQTRRIEGDMQRQMSNISKLMQQGYQISDQRTSMPIDVESFDPQMEQMSSELTTLSGELASFMTSSQELQNQVNAISNSWNARIADQQEINRRSVQSAAVTGIRLGGRYSANTTNSLISAAESAGLKQIATFEGQKQAAIIEAKQAAKKQNWDVYLEAVRQAEKKEEAKAEVLKELQKEAVKKNAELAEKKRQVTVEGAIVGLVDQDIKDPADIFDMINYNEQGQLIGDVTLEEIDGALERLSGGTSLDLGADWRMLEYSKEQGWLSPTATIFDYWRMKGDATRAPKEAGSSGLPNQVITQIDKLAKDFDSAAITKNYVEVQNKKITVDNILRSGIKGPADLALVFEFMKALDPTSVVRESEYESAAKSGNIFAGTFARFNGYFDEGGGFLPERVREDFQSLVDIKMDAAITQYENLRSETARKINRKTGDIDGADYLTNYDVMTNAGVANNMAVQESDAQARVEELYVENPEVANTVDQIIMENPGISFMDIVDILGI